MTFLRSLGAKAVLAQTVIAVLLIALVGALQYQRIRKEMYRDVDESAETALRVLQEVVAEDPGIYRAATFQPISQRFGARITYVSRLLAVDPSLRVIADSEGRSTGQTAEPGDFSEAMRRVRLLRRFIQSNGVRYLRLTVPVEGPYDETRGSTLLGALSIEMHLSTADTRIRRSFTTSALLLAALLILGVVGQGLLLRKAVLEPVRNLSQAAVRLGAGDLSARAGPGSKDEIGVLGQSFNSMAQRVAESSRRQAGLVEEVKAINRELREFAYVVSHDLKAPLRAIHSLAGWIAADNEARLDTAGKHQLELLLNRVTRMQNLIDGVLEYSRLGRVREKREFVDVGRIVADAADLLAAAPHIGIAVEGVLPVVWCERTRIYQAFQNLLGNAVRFCDKSTGQIRVGCVDHGETWKFYVADDGPGIDAKHFEKIFQIFQTLHARDELESTGVGLALVRKIVESHGGKIWVESEIGRGSTFFFTLPKRAEEDNSSERSGDDEETDEAAVG